MKKRYVLAMLCICVAIGSVFTGCSKGGNDPKAQITLEEMKDKMTETQEMPMLFSVDADVYDSIYGKSVEKLNDYIFYEGVSVSSARIFIAEVKEATDVESVKADFEDCAVKVQEIFETYLVDAYEMAKAFKIVTKGRYVLLVIAPDTDLCVQVFEDNIK